MSSTSGIKISQLNELASTEIAGADQIAVVDTSAGETKRMTITELDKRYGMVDQNSVATPVTLTAAAQIEPSGFKYERIYIQGDGDVTLTGSPKIAAGNVGDVIEIYNFTTHVVTISMTSGVHGPGQLEIGVGYNVRALFVYTDTTNGWYNAERSNG